MLPAFLATVLLAGPVVGRVPAPPREISSIPVSMLFDTGSGQVLYSRNPDLRFVPASMTKVMTAFVAFEEIAAGKLSQDHVYEVRPETSLKWRGKGTSMYLEPGERISARNLLHGIMTASANDASVVLAEGYAKNVPAWSLLMNDAARRLGMKDSRFGTPNGWPDEGKTYVSARDLVTLSTAMISRYPLLYEDYSGHRTFRWRNRTLMSHDPITGVVPGADGIKTGYTREAGYNFLGSAERDGRRLVMVIAGANSAAEREAASRALLEWGYSAWQARPLFRRGETVASARVQGGDARHVDLIAAGNIHAAMPREGNHRVALRLIYRGPLNAPVVKGAEVGELEISVDGMAPSRVPLQAGGGVGKADLMDRLWNGLMSLFA